MKKLLTLKDLKANKLKILFTSIFAAVVVLLSVLIGTLNITYSTNVSDKEYFLDNMLSHILSISEKEHSVYNEEEAEEVRNYISSTLFSYGVENEIITHNDVTLYNGKTGEFSYYKPKNIYAEIAGESGVNVLLVAHYDSCGYKIKYDEPSEGSHGALDDGYGVAAVLELARIFSSEKNLKNGIKIAIFDAEEEGVLGSEALVKEYPEWLDDVNLVINIEGRGNKGPVYLFQTSGNNSRIIDFYKNAGFPYSFSLAADVYDMLPNDTDLSPFLEYGYAGMNFAVLESLKVYHNDKDNYSSVDAATVAKYGDTLLPLVDEYTSNEKYSSINYFKDGHDTLFFTLFPNALVSYSAVTGWIFFGVIIALVGALTVISILKKKISWKRFLISLAIDLAFILVACGLGFLVAVLASVCSGVNYHVIFVIGVAFDGGLLIIFALLMAAAFVMGTLVKSRLGFTHSETALGGLTINTLLAIVCAAVLFGGTFIFVIPVLLYALGEGVKLFVKNEKVRTGVVCATCAVASVFTLSAYISLIYSLYVSLTFGALGLITVFAVLPLTMCVPQILGLFPNAPVKAEVKEAAV